MSGSPNLTKQHCYIISSFSCLSFVEEFCCGHGDSSKWPDHHTSDDARS